MNPAHQLCTGSASKQLQEWLNVVTTALVVVVVLVVVVEEEEGRKTIVDGEEKEIEREGKEEEYEEGRS